MLSLVMVTGAYPRKRGFNMLLSINKTKISPINLPQQIILKFDCKSQLLQETGIFSHQQKHFRSSDYITILLVNGEVRSICFKFPFTSPEEMRSGNKYQDEKSTLKKRQPFVLQSALILSPRFRITVLDGVENPKAILNSRSLSEVKMEPDSHKCQQVKQK